jgi:hypothetical protein
MDGRAMTMTTDTGLTVDVKPATTLSGKLLMALDGECFVLTANDAMRIAEMLHDVSARVKS